MEMRVTKAWVDTRASVKYFAVGQEGVTGIDKAITQTGEILIIVHKEGLVNEKEMYVMTPDKIVVEVEEQKIQTARKIPPLLP